MVVWCISLHYKMLCYTMLVVWYTYTTKYCGSWCISLHYKMLCFTMLVAWYTYTTKHSGSWCISLHYKMLWYTMLVVWYTYTTKHCGSLVYLPPVYAGIWCISTYLAHLYSIKCYRLLIAWHILIKCLSDLGLLY